MSVAEARKRQARAEPDRMTERARRFAERPVRALFWLTAFSIVLRMLFVSAVQAPTVFSDEIGYQKLAQSIGLTGHLALFNDRGCLLAPVPGSSISDLRPRRVGPDRVHVDQARQRDPRLVGDQPRYDVEYRV